MYEQKKPADSSTSSPIPVQYLTTNNRHPLNQHAKLLCVICGDCASGKHYGAASCEGCKGFFKRTIRRELIYNCRNDGNCTIDRNERNRCKYCRFQKCINTGMKREAVQEERRQRNPTQNQQQQQQQHQQQQQQHQQIMGGDEVTTSQLAIYPGVNNEFINLVKNLSMESMSKALQGKRNIGIGNQQLRLEVPFLRVNSNSMIQPHCQLHVMQFCQLINQELHQLITRVRLMPQFAKLALEDQILLLKESWLELLIVQAAWYTIVDGIGNAKNNYLAAGVGNRKRNQLMNSDLQRLYLTANIYYEREDAIRAGLENLYTRILCSLCAKFQRHRIQPEEIACLQAVILFKPEMRGLKDMAKISLCRDKIYACLHQHCCTKYSTEHGRFENLLLRLPELRSISLKCLDQLIIHDIMDELDLERIVANELRK